MRKKDHLAVSAKVDLIRLCCTLCASMVLIGCGKNGPERVTVSGTVTYQGQPLREGMIRLVPMPGTSAPVSTAPIIDGRYSLNAHGGVPVGSHKIEITAYRPNSNRSPPAADELEFPGMEAQSPVVQIIPDKYNSKSELEITVTSGSGEITNNFDLVK